MKFNLIKNFFDFYKHHGKLQFSSNLKRILIGIEKRRKLIEIISCIIVILLSVVLLNVKLIRELFDEYSEKYSVAAEDDGKIDWHDWDLIGQDELRDRIGEHGEAASLYVYPRSSKLINNTHGYNGFLSDQIALNRAIKDLRPTEYV